MCPCMQGFVLPFAWLTSNLQNVGDSVDSDDAVMQHETRTCKIFCAADWLHLSGPVKTVGAVEEMPLVLV
jgi:hypothetical protein